MADYQGMFYGYRQGGIPAVGRVQLGPWELDGKTPYTMQVFSGNAPDAYAAMQTFAIGQTQMLLLQVWDNEGIFQMSRDGDTYEDELEMAPEKNLGSWFHRMAAYGFRIKSKQAGMTARYQVIAFR